MAINDAITLLTDHQIWGDKNREGQLQVMKADGCGIKTGMSDLAIVLGGYMGEDTTDDGQRAGYVWSASSSNHMDPQVRAVHWNGSQTSFSPHLRSLGVRPVLPASVTDEIFEDTSSYDIFSSDEIFGVEVLEFGDYPQTIAPADVSAGLEQAFTQKTLQTTGHQYTFDSEERDYSEKPFSPKQYAEYEKDGKRYIRVQAKPFDERSVLSNGHRLEKGEVCWIEVQPIKWLVDPSGTWVTWHALVSGVPFDNKEIYLGNFEDTGIYDGNFENTGIKHYLQNYFGKEAGLAGLVARSTANATVDTVAAAPAAAVAAPEPTLSAEEERLTHQRQILASGTQGFQSRVSGERADLNSASKMIR